MSHKLEQLELELEKNIGIEKHAGKVRKLQMFHHPRPKQMKEHHRCKNSLELLPSPAFKPQLSLLAK